MDAMDTDRESVRGATPDSRNMEEARSSPAHSSFQANSFSISTPKHTSVAASSPIEPQVETVVNNVPGFRYKYPEAGPTPPGIDDISWNKLYTAADSRMYNKHGKDATSSRKYRASGETRALALVMMEEKRKKEASGVGPRPSKPKNAHVPAAREFPISSRDGTPSSDILSMSISEKIKAEGRARKTSTGPASTGGTPQPSGLGGKEFIKKGIAKSTTKSTHKRRKLDHTPSSSARASQTPDIAMAYEATSEYDSDASTRSGTLYCICKKPDDHSLMIECAGCRNWFHPPCMRIPEQDVKDDLVDRFVCDDCTTPALMTNFKRICRRYNVDKKFGKCRKAARVNDTDHNGKPTKPSKYCSDECREVFWKYVASLLRKDDRTSVGGSISRDEVAILLEACPTASAFHQLGRKPKLAEGSDAQPEQPHKLRFMSDHEADCVKALEEGIKVKEQRIADYQNQHKLLKMVNDRGKRANLHLGKDNKTAICGYDYRLCFNIDEFIVWFASEEGQEAFSTGLLGPISEKTRRIHTFLPQNPSVVLGDNSDDIKDMCLIPKRNKCKHSMWRELHNQEFGELTNQCRSDIAMMEREIIERVERAETREATALYYADNRTKYWVNPSDPLPGN